LAQFFYFIVCFGSWILMILSILIIVIVGLTLGAFGLVNISFG